MVGLSFVWTKCCFNSEKCCLYVHDMRTGCFAYCGIAYKRVVMYLCFVIWPLGNIVWSTTCNCSIFWEYSFVFSMFV